MVLTGQMGAVVYAPFYQRNQFLSFSLGLESAQRVRLGRHPWTCRRHGRLYAGRESWARSCLPTRRRITEVVSLPLVWDTPLRRGNLRDPNGPQTTFASESFINELAVAANADPVDFRLRLLSAGDDNSSSGPAPSPR
jgi:hypothetical protein